jgi:hypothetical protein
MQVWLPLVVLSSPVLEILLAVLTYEGSRNRRRLDQEERVICVLPVLYGVTNDLDWEGRDRKGVNILDSTYGGGRQVSTNCWPPTTRLKNKFKAYV